MVKVLVKTFDDVWDFKGRAISDEEITKCINDCMYALYTENENDIVTIKKIDTKVVTNKFHNNGRGNWVSLVYTITYDVV